MRHLRRRADRPSVWYFVAARRILAIGGAGASSPLPQTRRVRQAERRRTATAPGWRRPSAGGKPGASALRLTHPTNFGQWFRRGPETRAERSGPNPPYPPPPGGTSRLLFGFQHGQEGFLRDLDLADLLHALLAGG